MRDAGHKVFFIINCHNSPDFADSNILSGATGNQTKSGIV